MSTEPFIARLPRMITPEECVFPDSSRLLESYGRIREALRSIAHNSSLNAESPAFIKACADLEKLAAKLTQKRYRIGFIGMSQSGKSTTVGYIVGAKSDDENPASPGGCGRAATAIATRIIPMAQKHNMCRDGEDHFVELVYLTTEQFRARVRQIFHILNIEPSADQTPQSWLEQFRQHAKTSPNENSWDRDVAIRLLEAAIRFPQLVTSEPPIEPGSFARDARENYVLHPRDGELVSQYALLREMRVWYHTDRVPESLELIVLPGLSFKRISDETLTTAFLPELNSAFLFQEQSQLESEVAAKLTAKMRQEYGETIGGRIWMVVTKCDQFREDDEVQDVSTSDGKFKTIANMTQHAGVPLQNVILVSNSVYRASILEPDQPPQAWWTKAKAQWTPRFQADGNPEDPIAVTANAGLRAAYHHLVLTGGVNRLREHAEQAAASIGVVIQSEAQGVIDRVAKTVATLNHAEG